PAIEIADSRIADWTVTIADTVADNASAGLFVSGASKDARRHGDLADLQMTLRDSREIVSQGTGAATMGGPYRALAWLARHLLDRGDRLKAGDIVISGALG